MILWGNEHEARARALANICGEAADALANLSRSNEGIQPPNCSDETLTFWGHGDAKEFCELVDIELCLLVRNWKRSKSTLKTVELVTCDAQHNMQPLGGYARRVAQYMQANKIAVTIKALPRGQHSDDESILWANAGTRTLCYITAPSQRTLDHANNRLQALSPGLGNDLGLVAAAMAKERTLSEPNNFTVNGTGLDHLRPMLVVVRGD
ncbi:MAG: hypothetical protein R3B09_27095 [Nannocystaceae bacterium]